MNSYTFLVHWSEEDQAYIGTCAEFRSLSHIASSDSQALSGIQDLVKNVAEDITQK